MRYSCRCRKCFSRKVLPKHPNEYIRPGYPKCNAIGCNGIMRIDKYRMRGRTDKAVRAKDSGGKLCNDYLCDLPYPHREKSLGCFYHEANTIFPK